MLNILFNLENIWLHCSQSPLLKGDYDINWVWLSPEALEGETSLDSEERDQESQRQDGVSSCLRSLPANRGSPMEEDSEWTKKGDT